MGVFHSYVEYPYNSIQEGLMTSTRSRVIPSLVAFFAALMLAAGMLGLNVKPADAHVIPPSTGVDLICPAPSQPEQGIQLQINTQKFPSSPSTLTVTVSAKGLSDVSTIVDNISSSSPSGKLKNAIPAEFGLGEGFSANIAWTADGGGQADFGPFKCTIDQPTPAPTPVASTPPTPAPTPVVKNPKPAKPSPVCIRATPSATLSGEAPPRVPFMGKFRMNFVARNNGKFPQRYQLGSSWPRDLVTPLSRTKFNFVLAPGKSKPLHVDAQALAAAANLDITYTLKGTVTVQRVGGKPLCSLKSIGVSKTLQSHEPFLAQLAAKFRVH